ncbi:MAG TPA: hypothetical protein VLA21_11675, partial [Candidatus Limnocylindria bacterium]|nr:hypothetical protein [Candidatus Limnocylindria bacterium]
MDRKHAVLIEELLARVGEAHRPLLRELAEAACALGYRPARAKAKDFRLDFRNPKARRTLLKLEENEQGHGGPGCGERGVPGVRLRFHASADFSGVFREGVRLVVEEYGGRYTGCYGCGKCGAKKFG